MDTVHLLRTYKYRLYPTPTQERALEQMLSIGWRIWNDALHERQMHYQHYGKTLTWQEQSKRWRVYRRQHPELQVISSDMVGWLIHRLDKAYAAFFRRLKNGQNGGFPKDKARRDFTSLDIRYYGSNRLYVPDESQNGGWAKLNLLHTGSIRLRYHQPIPATYQPKVIVVMKESDGWYACLQCEDKAAALPERKDIRAVGLDIGLAYLIALSDGHVVNNPHWYVSAQQERRVLQRKLDRQRRSNPKNAGNYNDNGTVKAGAFIWYSSARQKETEAKLRELERTVARQRLLMWHTITDRLTRQYTDIALEELSISFMLDNPHLAMHARDAAFGIFYELLAYKAHERNVRLHFVPAHYTSQTCGQCGHVDSDNRRSQAHFQCQSCGFTENADLNAARNILARADFDWRQFAGTTFPSVL